MGIIGVCIGAKVTNEFLNIVLPKGKNDASTWEFEKSKLGIMVQAIDGYSEGYVVE